MTLHSPADHDRFIRLHADDNVVVLRADIRAGEPLWQGGLSANHAVRRGHKIATEQIGRGEAIRKYGQVIGFATEAIQPGDKVHSHNLGMGDVALDYAIGSQAKAISIKETATFQGYPRADGRAGTRNYVVVLSSVNCSATVSRRIAGHFSEPDALAAWPWIDGVIGLTHGGGCALDPKSDGYRLLTRTIAGYAAHPNVCAVLMVGLGCEINQIPMLLDRQGLATSERLKTFTIQDTGGTRASVLAGIAAVGEMLDCMTPLHREPVPAAKLMLGLQCGGSDSYSGITANPALGHTSDLLVRQGGTAVLAETPEIYGAEHLLTRRAVSQDVAEKLLRKIDWWRRYTALHGAEMDNNPSHGNKQGGLTTILEKSLGAVAKAGTSPLTAVYDYAERIETPGFVFMDSPGYDPVSVTGQVASGCNLVAFTNGRGSVSGFKPAPTLKLATNAPMYARMEDDMDVDCSGIVDGQDTIEGVGERIFRLMLDVASGKQTKSEILDYGDNEFVPWPIGAVM